MTAQVSDENKPVQCCGSYARIKLMLFWFVLGVYGLNHANVMVDASFPWLMENYECQMEATQKRVWEAPVWCFVLPMQLQPIEVSKRKY